MIYNMMKHFLPLKIRERVRALIVGLFASEWKGFIGIY